MSFEDKDALLYLADVRIDELQAENAKLRELVRDMWGWALHGCGACSEMAGCDTDLYSSDCLMREMLADRVHELGVDDG